MGLQKDYSRRKEVCIKVTFFLLFLFVILGEALSGMVARTGEGGLLSGFQLARGGLEITHLNLQMTPLIYVMRTRSRLET